MFARIYSPSPGCFDPQRKRKRQNHPLSLPVTSLLQPRAEPQNHQKQPPFCNTSLPKDRLTSPPRVSRSACHFSTWLYVLFGKPLDRGSALWLHVGNGWYVHLDLLFRLLESSDKTHKTAKKQFKTTDPKTSTIFLPIPRRLGFGHKIQKMLGGPNSVIGTFLVFRSLQR